MFHLHVFFVCLWLSSATKYWFSIIMYEVTIRNREPSSYIEGFRLKISKQSSICDILMQKYQNQTQPSSEWLRNMQTVLFLEGSICRVFFIDFVFPNWVDYQLGTCEYHTLCVSVLKIFQNLLNVFGLIFNDPIENAIFTQYFFKQDRN